MNRSGRIVLAWAPAFLYMALIWVMSSLSHPSFPVDSFPLADKGVHFVEYGVLGLLVAYATRRSFPGRHALRLAAVAMLVATGWGALDELHQAFVPARSADALDVLADAIGASAGVTLHLMAVVAATARRARARG